MAGRILKNRILSAVLAMLTVFSLMPVCAGAEPVKTEKRYLALGDSITTGYMLGGGHYTEEAFVSITAEQCGYIPSNKAADGNTSADILAQIETGKLDDEIASADLITITCGGNDLLAYLCDSFTVTLDEVWQGTSAGLNDIIKRLGMDAYITEIPETVPETETAADGGKTEYNRTLQFMYAVFSSFVGGIDDSLAGIDSAGENTPYWKRLLFDSYESMVYRTLDSAEAKLIAMTETEEFREVLQQYTDRLNAVVDYIRALNEDVRIVVLNQYNPYQWFDTPASGVLRNFFTRGIRPLNAAIMQNSKSGRYRVADVYTVFASSEVCLANAVSRPLELDIHPNAAGHAAIADCLQDVLSRNWWK